jgi:hypothetical protein
MAKRGEIVDLTYYAVIARTDKAWMIAFEETGDVVAIPKSLGEIDEDSHTITVPTWMAEEKGIEDYAK